MKFNDYLNEISFKKTSAFASGQKTVVSVDFTSDCPKRRAGHACPYCYVEYKREINFNAKLVYDYKAYDNELKDRKKFNPEMVKELNDAGGIRLFSFGDYMPENDKDIEAFLNDAEKINLDVKVITKVPEFVYKYHDYPAVKTINISTDMLPADRKSGVDHDIARELKAKYKKVIIRTVILNDKDLEDDFMKYVDIVTFNHENLQKKGFKKYSKKEVMEYYKKHPELGVCCITGKCSTCPIKCRQRDFSQTCLMA
jgi:hypothetical protein